MRSTIHISNEHNAIEAIYAGVDTLAHPVIQSPISAAFVNLMRTKRVPMASTLTIGESYSRLADHPEYLDQPLYRDTMEAAEIQRLKTVESPRQREDRWAQWMKVMTPVCAGQPAASQRGRQGHRRARHRPIVGRRRPSRAGAAGRRRHHARRRASSSRRATRRGSSACSDEIGTIELGKIADLVLLDADPDRRTSTTRSGSRPSIRNGVVIDRAKLDLPVNRRWRR